MITTGKNRPGNTRTRGLLVFLVFALSAVVAIDAAERLSAVPDTAPARRSQLATIMEPIRPGGEDQRLYLSPPGALPVLFRTEHQNDRRYYIFMPADGEAIALAVPGTFIVRRRLDDGEFDQIKVFLQHDEGSYLRLFPRGRTTVMDLYIAGKQLYHEVPVSISMERALTATVEQLQQLTSASVDWSVLDVDPSRRGYQVIATMAEQIREALPSLPDAEDGAMDENGNLVFIESLVMQNNLPGFNCSGFAKWVVDGIYQSKTGRLLSIEPLKVKHLDYRGTSWSVPREDDRDPYFGLDWTRNLAIQMAALEVNMDPAMMNPEAQDVRDVPLAEYTEDVGYRMQALQTVLYWLAQREPGTFYLGSVNELFGTAPVLRQHTHVVALFPWFDEPGRFQVTVMERNVESSVESLERRYPNDFIHLVRVSGSSDFEVPRFNLPSVD